MFFLEYKRITVQESKGINISTVLLEKYVYFKMPGINASAENMCTN